MKGEALNYLIVVLGVLSLGLVGVFVELAAQSWPLAIAAYLGVWGVVFLVMVAADHRH